MNADEAETLAQVTDVVVDSLSWADGYTDFFADGKQRKIVTHRVHENGRVIEVLTGPFFSDSEGLFEVAVQVKPVGVVLSDPPERLTT